MKIELFTLPLKKNPNKYMKIKTYVEIVMAVFILFTSISDFVSPLRITVLL